MSKTKHKAMKQTAPPPTVITITLPEEDTFQRSGSMVIQRGELAQIRAFTYTSLSDITAAIDDALSALEAIENDPPPVRATSSPKPTRTPDDLLKQEPETPREPEQIPCPTCRGSGHVKTVMRIVGIDMETLGVYLDCEGSGKVGVSEAISITE